MGAPPQAGPPRSGARPHRAEGNGARAPLPGVARGRGSIRRRDRVGRGGASRRQPDPRPGSDTAGDARGLGRRLPGGALRRRPAGARRLPAAGGGAQRPRRLELRGLGHEARAARDRRGGPPALHVLGPARIAAGAPALTDAPGARRRAAREGELPGRRLRRVLPARRPGVRGLPRTRRRPSRRDDPGACRALRRLPLERAVRAALARGRRPLARRRPLLAAAAGPARHRRDDAHGARRAARAAPRPARRGRPRGAGAHPGAGADPGPRRARRRDALGADRASARPRGGARSEPGPAHAPRALAGRPLLRHRGRPVLRLRGGRRHRLPLRGDRARPPRCRRAAGVPLLLVHRGGDGDAGGGAARLRGLHRPGHRPHRLGPPPPRLPLRAVRADRGQAARRPLRDAGGGGGSTAAGGGLRRPLPGGAAGHPGLGGELLAEAARAALRLPAGGRAPRRGRQHRRVRDVARARAGGGGAGRGCSKKSRVTTATTASRRWACGTGSKASGRSSSSSSATSPGRTCRSPRSGRTARSSRR